MNKPMLLFPVIVEGKYDKIKLDSLFEGQFLTTEGFGIFNNKEKQSFFKRLARKTPLIIFTDSDNAGRQIRNYFRSILPANRQIHLYIPPVKGKEKRKNAPSAEGLLGVEGSESSVIKALFSPYIAENAANSPKEDCSPELTRAEFYAHGYAGGENSSVKRKSLCRLCALPENLSATALLEALNLLYTREELEELLNTSRESL